MRYYLDEDLSPTIAEIARNRGLDVISSHECGRNGLKDEEQLRSAGIDGRCLITRDRDHMVALTVRFLELGLAHAGLLIVPASMPSSRFALVAAALSDYDHQHPEGISPYTVDYLHPPRR